MFAKLLKYEWKATAGLLGILSAAAVGVGSLGGLCLRLLFTTVESVGEGDTNGVVMLPLILLLMFSMLGLGAYMFAVHIILYARFYKSRFTDEGYLTFTLPVSATENFLSALTNILIWQVICGAVMFLSFGLFVVLGATGIPGLEATLEFSEIGQAFRLFLTQSGDGLQGVLSVLLGIVSFICAPVLIMFCITMGAVLAKKHKILASIGIYYGVSMAVSMLTSVGSAMVLVNGLESNGTPDTTLILISSGIQLIVQLGLAVGGSFLTVRLMEKKLNLP